MIFDIDKKANKIINERKKIAEDNALQSLSLARKNEEFLSLEKEENSLIVEIAKTEFEGKNSEKLRENLEKTQKNKENLLKKLNLSLKIKYFCEKCLDTGIISGKNCECKKKVINQILKKESGISNNFSFVDAKLFSDEEKILFDKMKVWCENFPNVKSKSIFLSGEMGVGKTFLCEAMANELINKNVFVYFTTAFNLNNLFSEFCKTNNKEILDLLLSCEVLFIDDLGTEPIFRNITLNYLYLVLNERLISGKAVVINTNLMPDEILKRYGEHIFSRIMNKQTGLVLCYKGKDRRVNC